MSVEPAEPLIRARLTDETIDYPHNDLESAAWLIHDRLRSASEAGELPPGNFFDLIALIAMLSFALEGYMNALGWHAFNDCPDRWAKIERRSTYAKIKVLAKIYKLEVDWKSRPFSTVKPLVDLRNLFAHPKVAPAPERDQELIGRFSDFKQMLRDRRPEYQARLTWGFADQAYRDVDSIWTTLREASGIAPFDLFSGGSQGIELLAHINPDGTERPAL